MHRMDILYGFIFQSYLLAALVIFCCTPAIYCATISSPTVTDATDFTHSYTTSEPFETTSNFEENLCINGEDVISTSPPHESTTDATTNVCNCSVQGQEYFEGEQCEDILFNDDLLNVSSSARTGNFTWPAPPQISEDLYSFVYTACNHTDKNIYRQEFNMITNSTARIIQLESGNFEYVVCVYNNELASEIVDSKNYTFLNSSSSACLTLVTAEGLSYAYTIAAFVIAAFLIVTLIVLIILKLIVDKIENKENYEKMKVYKQNLSKQSDVDELKHDESDEYSDKSTEYMNSLSRVAQLSPPPSKRTTVSTGHASSANASKHSAAYTNPAIPEFLAAENTEDDLFYEPEIDY